MDRTNQSVSSNKYMHLGFRWEPAPLSHPDPAAAGDRDRNALNDMHRPNYPPPNADDLGSELGDMYAKSAKLQPSRIDK
ncbi:hypothetical protein FCULG_00010011 [Fusarium culmorum]|uniref:Uncharacterized protein n=1 Tax=Fusarium culmorum TaxID=5516 RepID=A0A2T4GDK7_FUSCU|nr:hypothetical protein FCULG_00010011 [Fusarium culmorum]